MDPPKERRTEVRVASRFRDSFRKHKKMDPRILGQLTIFNKSKRAIPPTPLPVHFKDHALKGKLKGLRECHLAHEILLIYTHENDTLELLLVCDHRDLDGAKVQKAAKRARNAK